MRLSVRHPFLLAAAVAAAGCVKGLNDVAPPPSGSPFDANDQVYFFDATRMTYLFTDTSGTNDFHLRWLSDTVFSGYNCIGFRPRSPTDTIGTFKFYWFGGNAGLLERSNHGTVDTVQGLFLTGLEGTKGTYAVNQAGQVKLFWQDWNGTPTRYFDATASIRFEGDTLRSTADLRFQGDSIRTVWDTRWINRASCGT